MILSVKLALDGPSDPALERYLLFRDQIHPVLEEKRGALDAMYDPAIGRPEIDPQTSLPHPIGSGRLRLV